MRALLRNSLFACLTLAAGCGAAGPGDDVGSGALALESPPDDAEAAVRRGPVVALPQGKIAGTYASVDDKRVEKYLGIPYAPAPIGNLRWAPTGAPPNFANGWRDATASAPLCLQTGGVPAGSEDCLYVNVFRPAAASLKARPVMVFFHGGAYATGGIGGPLYGTGYDGASLAARGDAIVVTVQYRLGNLGYVSVPALSRTSGYGGSGNYGTMDQIAALAWVQSNAGALGGDPKRVTIFGESAGANSVMTLIASPKAQGLFQQGIAESGPITYETLAAGERRGTKLASTLCPTEAAAKGDAALLACLRASSASAVAAVNTSDYGEPIMDHAPGVVVNAVSRPVIDGYVLPASPVELVKTRSPMPVLVGTNSFEMGFFVPLSYSQEYETAALSAMFGSKLKPLLASYPGLSADDQSIALATDVGFTCSANRFLDAMTANGSSKVFQYQYRYNAALPLGATLPPIHTAELLPVFGLLSSVATPDNLYIEGFMQSAWINFVHSGDPNSGPGGALGVNWGARGSGANKSYMAIDRRTFGPWVLAKPAMGVNVAQAVCALAPENR